MSLSQEQVRTLHCLRQWLEIRSEAGHALPTSVNELWEAVDHSALLRRLLEGNDPLPAPPPLSFGQPWYELSEYGFAKCTSVERMYDELLINGAHWQIVEERGEDEFLVSGSGVEDPYLLWKMPALLTDEKSATDWIIERVSNASV